MTCLPKIAAGTVQSIGQREENATYAPKITRSERWLDWTRPAVELVRQVRAFNPLTTRKQDFISRMFTRVTNLGSLNKRMHNKALIADNQMAIMGGRNLGDAYFEKFTNATFKDIDILAAGPIVTQISRSFDEY